MTKRLTSDKSFIRAPALVAIESLARAGMVGREFAGRPPAPAPPLFWKFSVYIA